MGVPYRLAALAVDIIWLLARRMKNGLKLDFGR
jgi:hypothetical protein